MRGACGYDVRISSLAIVQAIRGFSHGRYGRDGANAGCPIRWRLRRNSCADGQRTDRRCGCTFSRYGLGTAGGAGAAAV